MSGGSQKLAMVSDDSSPCDGDESEKDHVLQRRKNRVKAVDEWEHFERVGFWKGEER